MAGGDRRRERRVGDERDLGEGVAPLKAVKKWSCDWFSTCWAAGGQFGKTRARFEVSLLSGQLVEVVVREREGRSGIAGRARRVSSRAVMVDVLLLVFRRWPLRVQHQAVGERAGQTRRSSWRTEESFGSRSSSTQVRCLVNYPSS